MRENRRGAKSTMQEHVQRIGMLASSIARADTSCEMIQQKQEVYLVRAGSLLYPELLHQEGLANTVTGTGRKKVAKNSTRQINSKRGVERNNTRTFTIGFSVIRGSERL